MAFQVSPGINVSEIDLTAVVPSVATTSGGFVGNFRWGPVEQVVLVTSEDRLVENFRAPVADHANNAADFMVAANFLAYSNQLNTVRVVDTTTALNAVANTDGTSLATLHSSLRTMMTMKITTVVVKQGQVSSMQDIQAHLVTH